MSWRKCRRDSPNNRGSARPPHASRSQDPPHVRRPGAAVTTKSTEPGTRLELSQLRQRDVQDPRFPRGTIPLDENRALVGTFDQAVGSVRPLGNEQAHGTAHPEETSGWNSERPCEQSLDNRSAESKRIETLVEHPDEIVLRVAERLGRHGARVGERTPALLLEEPERVSEHFRQVVLHQERFVLVDRQS